MKTRYLLCGTAIAPMLMLCASSVMAAQVALPDPVQSPVEDPRAPYTPVVRSLIDQLLPGDHPSAEQIRIASALISTQGSNTGGSNPSCHNLANVVVQAHTTPSITPLCFTDGLGISVLFGPNKDRTTGFPSTLMLGSSFNLRLANAMGQAEGAEGRALMVTGLLGPQADTDVFVNWSRGHHTPGEDPYLNGLMTAAQVNGMQGRGLMAQIKHFAGYYGTADNAPVTISDQALHEMMLTPYEIALKQGGAASLMCSYQWLEVTSRGLPFDAPALTSASPYGASDQRTWPLAGKHYACEHPLLLNHVVRGLWNSHAFIGSDYGGVHSASAFLQGLDREDPGQDHLGRYNPGQAPVGDGPLGPPPSTLDETGLTCADTAGGAVACSTPGARHVAGIPGPDCPDTGCSIPNAVANGTVPLVLLKQSLARVLYQIERFGLLGCAERAASCTNPGGIGADRSGTAPLPDGPADGTLVLGTRSGGAAIAQQVAEQGAILLKNPSDGRLGLPITAANLMGGIAVSGGGAEFLIANPNNEGATGFAERNAISPLEQLKTLSGRAAAISYTPANSPSGRVVACDTLSAGDEKPTAPPSACSALSGLARLAGGDEGSLAAHGTDRELDFTHTSRAGALPGGIYYRWQGWVYVGEADKVRFRFQLDPAVDARRLNFALDGQRRSVKSAESFYHGQYYGTQAVDVSRTNAGHVEAGLQNRQCAVPAETGKRTFGPPPADVDAQAALARGEKPVEAITPCDGVVAPGWHHIAIDLDTRGVKGDASFRFAWSRPKADIMAAARDARGKAMAIVFVHDEGRNALLPFPVDDSRISSLNEDQRALIEAVAAANRNTVVVLNTGTPVIVKEWIDNPNIRSVLNMWHPGQEGGTATARLLLGHASPGGHTTITWPMRPDDTVQHYVQPFALGPGDTPGAHPERANGGKDGSSAMTQGIFSGYRFYDRFALPVQFPFGFGLTYTHFAYSGLRHGLNRDGSMTLRFTIRNTGKHDGAAVPQVYVGPGQAKPLVQQAVRALAGFERVELKPGEAREVSITVPERAFQSWSEEHQRWETNVGRRRIWVAQANDAADVQFAFDQTIGSGRARKR